jgi:hypothetical protein
VLEEIASDGLPDLHSRRDLARATAAIVTANTPYGPILKHVPLISITGEPISMLVTNPFAMLWRAVAQGGSFSKVMIDKLQASPCSPEAPWRLALYSDEVVPGNQLSHDNRRKVWVVYYSFLELGTSMMAKEDSWFCLLAKRSSEVAEVSGGMSQIFGAIAKLFFGADVHNLSTGGMVLSGPDGQNHRLFAKLSMFLQDGGAHKVVWHCKGDAGTKLCMLCRNLYSRESELVDEDGTNLLTCSLIFEADLDFATDGDIRGSVRRLATSYATDPTPIFKRWSMAIGFRHEPHNMLLDPMLDTIVQPASQLCHDWMHAIFVNGIFNTIGYLVIESLMEDGVRNIWDTLFNYVGTWTFPFRVHSNALQDVFCKKRMTSSRKAKHLKCTASDGLSVYTLVAYFLQSVVMKAGRCIAQCKVFLAMADMIDLLVVVPLGLTTPAVLKTHVESLLTLCIAAGWRDMMHPKFHWLVHLPHMLAHFGSLPTCWVHERKHRMVKRYANDICNTTVFEQSVLNEVTAHHLSCLAQSEAFQFGVGLVHGRPAPRKMLEFLSHEFGIQLRSCRTAITARISEHATCHKGDVVILRSDGDIVVVGMVWFHAETEGECLSLVSVWTQLSKCADTGSAEYSDIHNPLIVPTGDILSSVVYTRPRPGVVRVLVPCQFRALI